MCPPRRQTNEILREAFQNNVIIREICSFMKTEQDLLNLRLVSHLFQRDATKLLSRIHSTIEIKDEATARKFIKCMIKRKKLNLVPKVPFSDFVINLDIAHDTLLALGVLCYHGIRRYSFTLSADEMTPMHFEMNSMMTLLSYAPELEEIKVTSVCAPRMTGILLLRLPITFPKLKKIDVTYHQNRHFYQYPHGLIEALVQRSPNLDFVRLPSTQLQIGYHMIPDAEPIRALAQAHPDISSVSFDREVVLNILTQGWLDELLTTKFRFAVFKVKITYRNDNGDLYAAPVVEAFSRKLNQWLTTQSDKMEKLSITFNRPHATSVSFRIPTLKVLNNLALKFQSDVDSELPLEARPVEPLTPNQFPGLKKLRLMNYREDYRVFGLSSLPSVEKLHLESHRNPFINSSWLLTFPNLTFLKIGLHCDVEDVVEPSVEFILTHLAHLVHLDLELVTTPGWPFRSVASCAPELWETLTGGAPRPLSRRAVWDGFVGQAPGEMAKPVQGIFEVSSLRNLRALKTFRFRPGNCANLDAVTFMTRAGLLVRLEKLTLISLREDLNMNVFELMQYDKQVDQLHNSVELY